MYRSVLKMEISFRTRFARCVMYFKIEILVKYDTKVFDGICRSYGRTSIIRCAVLRGMCLKNNVCLKIMAMSTAKEIVFPDGKVV